MCDTLEITTTVGCPNACKLCPQELFVSRYKDDHRYLSFDNFKKCINKIPNYVRIDFSGFSEPWINPDCTKMILYTHTLGFKITVFTTCVGMKEGDIEIIKSIPFEAFVVHLPDNDNNMKMPAVTGYMELLNRIKHESINNIRYMAMGPLHILLKDLFGYEKFGFKAVNRAGNMKDKIVKKKKGSIRCAVSPKMRRNILLPNGDVVLCCMDYGMKHILGNLLDKNYHDLFSGQQYKNIINGLNHGKSGDVLCRYCNWSRSRMNTNYITLREYAKQLIKSCLSPSISHF